MKQLEEHDELLWQVLQDGHKGPLEIVNVDAHSDLAMFNGHLDIGNFISKMVDLGLVNRATWIRDPNSVDLVEGKYKFWIGATGPQTRLRCSLRNPFYFLDGSYATKETMNDPKELSLAVITDLSKPTMESHDWILSVDYDYFGCLNPNGRELAGLVELVGAETISALYAKGSSVQTLSEWQEFRAEVERLAPGIFDRVSRCLLPNSSYTEEQIMQKVVALSSFINKSRDASKCLGVYLINSVSSGFTDPAKFQFIDECVKAWVSRMSSTAR